MNPQALILNQNRETRFQGDLERVMNWIQAGELDLSMILSSQYVLKFCHEHKICTSRLMKAVDVLNRYARKIAQKEREKKKQEEKEKEEQKKNGHVILDEASQNFDLKNAAKIMDRFADKMKPFEGRLR